MSFDRHLDQTCSHETVEEVLEGDEDRKIFRPLMPIASEASVKIRLNRLIPVPPEGVTVPAILKGSVRSPSFTVTGSNRILTLIVNQKDTPITFLATTGVSVLVSRIVSDLNKQSNEVRFEVVKDRIYVRTELGSEYSTVEVVNPSPFADLVGLPRKRARGATTVPGWSLVVDPSNPFSVPYRNVVFDSTLQQSNPYLEISYVTTVDNCRRCNGTGYEFDWRYDKKGNTGAVREDALLLQEFLKLFLTDIGSNPFHPWYGTSLQDRIGTKIVSGQATQAAIAADISEAFRRWQSIKRAQEDKIGQPVSDNEFPQRLLGVNVVQDDKNPTVVYVSVRIQKRSGDTVDFSRGFSLPSGSITAGTFRQSINRYTRAI